MGGDVFRALADASRRQLLDELHERAGQTLAELCAGKAITRQSVSKHLAILEGAGLVTSVRRGREKLHYVNARAISELSDRWLRRYDRHRADALDDLRHALEETTMSTTFAYTTYIRTTPERCWQALTDPAFTRRYWQGVEFDTDWAKGSTMTLRNEAVGLEIADPAQVVLEAQPFERLSYTWHTFTDAWARAYDVGAELLERLRSQPRSTVTFELEDHDGMVKLTVVHDGIVEGSAVIEGVRHGWPPILSSLKTLLETGEALPGS